MNPLTLSQYQQALSGFDWDYDYSDDPGVWERGRDRHAELRRISKQSPEHAALFAAWEAYRRGETQVRPVLNELEAA